MARQKIPRYRAWSGKSARRQRNYSITRKERRTRNPALYPTRINLSGTLTPYRNRQGLFPSYRLRLFSASCPCITTCGGTPKGLARKTPSVFRCILSRLGAAQALSLRRAREPYRRFITRRGPGDMPLHPAPAPCMSKRLLNQRQPLRRVGCGVNRIRGLIAGTARQSDTPEVRSRDSFHPVTARPARARRYAAQRAA